MISRLIREAIPSSFEKCVEDPCQTRWSDAVQMDIYYAAMHLIDLIIQRLEVRVCSCQQPVRVRSQQLVLFAAYTLPSVCLVQILISDQKLSQLR